MKIAPLRIPEPVAVAVGCTTAVLTFPIWGPVLAVVWVMIELERWLDPPRWHRVFAFWPVQCDPWPGDGYAGWVWLETVWRNPAAPGWTKYRREAPSSEAPPISPSAASAGNLATDEPNV